MMEDLPLPLWVIVLIPLVLGLAPFLYAAFERFSKTRAKQFGAVTAETSQKAIKAAKHTEALEQRVRVLERIVTDKGTVVADQIEALRDKPLN